MKYIVVYIILILGVSTLKTEAQKPKIDLLPSASVNMYPQAMIDTCVIPDSLFLLDSIAPAPKAEEKIISETTYTGEYSPALRRRTTKAVLLLKPGFLPLFIKNMNPIHFVIHLTALKF